MRCPFPGTGRSSPGHLPLPFSPSDKSSTRRVFPSARRCFPGVSCSSASQGQGWQLPFTSHLAELPPALGEGATGGDGLFSPELCNPRIGVELSSLERRERGGWGGSPLLLHSRERAAKRRCTAAFKLFPRGRARAVSNAPSLPKSQPEARTRGVSKHTHPSRPTAGALVATPAPSTAGLEQKACAEQEPWLVVYLLLGLCLCALLCSLLLGWTHLRRRGEVVSCQASAGTCHRGEDCSKGECWLHWGDWEGMGSWGWGAGIAWEGGKVEAVGNRGRETTQRQRCAMRFSLTREEEQGWTPVPRFSTISPSSATSARPQARLPPTQGLQPHHQPAPLWSPPRGRGVAEPWGGVVKKQPLSEANPPALGRPETFVATAATGATLG